MNKEKQIIPIEIAKNYQGKFTKLLLNVFLFKNNIILYFYLLIAHF